MLRRILIGDNERALLIRKRRFDNILGPGEHWMFTLGQGIEIEKYNAEDPVFASRWIHSDFGSGSIQRMPLGIGG